MNPAENRTYITPPPFVSSPTSSLSSSPQSKPPPYITLLPYFSGMTPETPLDKATYLVNSLEKYGQGDYIGESISQLEHCLQAAHQAQKSGTINTPLHYKSTKLSP